jgi:hypothetical protein
VRIFSTSSVVKVTLSDTVGRRARSGQGINVFFTEKEIISYVYISNKNRTKPDISLRLESFIGSAAPQLIVSYPAQVYI